MAKANWPEVEGTVASVERFDGRYGPSFTVVFTYKVNDSWCGGTFSGGEEYKVGDTFSVRYNPSDPDENDLSDKEQRKRTWLWILGIAGGLVILGRFLAQFPGR